VATPQTFRTSPGSYVALCGVLSVPLAIWILALFSRGRVDLAPLLISIALPAIAAIWLAYFRLQIDDRGIEYRELFGRSFSVAYSDVASLKSRTVSSGRGFGYEWVLHLHDGRRLRLNLKPFPMETYGALCQRIRCDA
jgi:hypothetical protein